jgi:hypothetical protein
MGLAGEARQSASHILSLSEPQLSQFVDSHRAERRLTLLVRSLNGLVAGTDEDRELGLKALRRLGLEPGG